jgi:PIN domain nuclease of toxin-antitoxin system
VRQLVDSHALLWWLTDDDKLGDRVRGRLSDPEIDGLMSAVCLWEVTVKRRVGKLDADIGEILGRPAGSRI